VYLRDERPHCGTAPPAVLYRYTPDRKGEHCRAELAGFTGWLHADGYAGFGKLYEIGGARSGTALLQGPPRVTEVACWAHVRRGFFDVHASNRSALAKEALDRIGALFDIERTIAGQPPESRRSVRSRTAKPRIDALATWLDQQLPKIPGKSDLAGAIRYARSRWQALTRYLDHGRLEISNNAAENQIRPVALGRKKLAVQRVRCRRSPCRRTLHAHPHVPAQRHRARGLPHRRDRAYRHPSDQPARRAAAMEPAATGDAWRRPLSRTSSSGRRRSTKGTLPVPLPCRGSVAAAQRVPAMRRTLLELVYEQDFLPCSYGFRPGRSAHQALRALRTGFMSQGLRWVIDLDIVKYFDSISHSHLRAS
jgi:hypothetical protein